MDAASACGRTPPGPMLNAPTPGSHGLAPRSDGAGAWRACGPTRSPARARWRQDASLTSPLLLPNAPRAPNAHATPHAASRRCRGRARRPGRDASPCGGPPWLSGCAPSAPACGRRHARAGCAGQGTPRPRLVLRTPGVRASANTSRARPEPRAHSVPRKLQVNRHAWSCDRRMHVVPHPERPPMRALPSCSCCAPCPRQAVFSTTLTRASAKTDTEWLQYADGAKPRR